MRPAMPLNKSAWWNLIAHGRKGHVMNGRVKRMSAKHFNDWSRRTDRRHYHTRHVRCDWPLQDNELPQRVVAQAKAIIKRSFWLQRRKYHMDVNAAQWMAIKDFVMARDRSTCHYCGAAATTVDHIIPVSKHGSWHPDNCVAACVTCNSSKGSKQVEEFCRGT